MRRFPFFLPRFRMGLLLIIDQYAAGAPAYLPTTKKGTRTTTVPFLFN